MKSKSKIAFILALLTAPLNVHAAFSISVTSEGNTEENVRHICQSVSVFATVSGSPTPYSGTCCTTDGSDSTFVEVIEDREYSWSGKVTGATDSVQGRIDASELGPVTVTCTIKSHWQCQNGTERKTTTETASYSVEVKPRAPSQYDEPETPIGGVLQLPDRPGITVQDTIYVQSGPVSVEQTHVFTGDVTNIRGIVSYVFQQNGQEGDCGIDLNRTWQEHPILSNFSWGISLGGIINSSLSFSPFNNSLSYSRPRVPFKRYYSKIWKKNIVPHSAYFNGSKTISQIGHGTMGPYPVSESIALTGDIAPVEFVATHKATTCCTSS